MAETLYVVPVGDVEGEILDYLCRELEESFGRSCLLADPLAHPAFAYHESREQYLSSYILEQLTQPELGHAFRVLGVVDLDLYVPELNFVFGQAAKGGRSALIGLPRLRQSFYGLPDDEELFRQRVVKEAVHELGHTLGLNHCPHRSCVMHFSNSLADTDFKERHFCPRCRSQLYGGR
jgi:archaemetzincin